jgi:deoxyribodipyrimidine photo-lyase
LNVPSLRIRPLNNEAVQKDSDYILYWMITNRRASWSFSLDRAIELCLEHNKPLLILEALRCDYQWASDRLHGFIMQGMADMGHQNRFRLRCGMISGCRLTMPNNITEI